MRDSCRRTHTMAAERLEVELGPVEVALFNDGSKESTGEAAKASCQKLKLVLEKWAKVPG